MNKTQLLLLKIVATFLINKNGSTTTLEIKDTLRERFPKMRWVQDEISQAMQEIHDNQVFSGLTFVDTGEFRVYTIDKSVSPQVTSVNGANPNTNGQIPVSLPTSQVATKPKSKAATLAKYDNRTPKSGKLSRTDIVELMKNSKGKFYTVTFIKTTGETRVMNGQTKLSNFFDNQGYINFRESNGKIRRVNPKTITEISISGNVYKVK